MAYYALVDNSDKLSGYPNSGKVIGAIRWTGDGTPTAPSGQSYVEYTIQDIKNGGSNTNDPDSHRSGGGDGSEAEQDGYYFSDVKKFSNKKLGNSWNFNTTTYQFEPPSNPGPEPFLTATQKKAGFLYEWNESNYNSDPSTGWTLISYPTQSLN